LTVTTEGLGDDYSTRITVVEGKVACFSRPQSSHFCLKDGVVLRVQHNYIDVLLEHTGQVVEARVHVLNQGFPGNQPLGGSCMVILVERAAET